MTNVDTQQPFRFGTMAPRPVAASQSQPAMSVRQRRRYVAKDPHEGILGYFKRPAASNVGLVATPSPPVESEIRSSSEAPPPKKAKSAKSAMVSSETPEKAELFHIPTILPGDETPKAMEANSAGSAEVGGDDETMRNSPHAFAEYRQDTLDFVAPTQPPGHDHKDFNKVMREMDQELAEENKKADLAYEAKFGVESSGPDKRQQLQEDLKKALAANAFPARGFLGNRMRRELPPHQANIYKALQSDSDREAFRLKWAARKLKKLEVGQGYLWRNIDRTRAEPMTLAAIALHYGYLADRESALRGALAYASKAARMGGSWVSRCPMSGLNEYMFVHREFIDDFTESWRMYEKIMGPEGGSDKHVDDTVEQLANTHGKNKEDQEENSTVDCNMKVNDEIEEKKSGKKSADNRQPGTKNVKTEKLFSMASKLRVRFFAASSKAECLISEVKADAKWGWANNPENIGQLENSLMTMKEKTRNETGAATVLQNELKQLRNDNCEERLTELLTAFCGLEGFVAEVEQVHRNLLAMQRVRRK